MHLQHRMSDLDDELIEDWMMGFLKIDELIENWMMGFLKIGL